MFNKKCALQIVFSFNIILLQSYLYKQHNMVDILEIVYKLSIT